jgi:NAD(P)-dependent dehydrogenase (short-subunit alcohol dehydrogenase family)
MGTNPNSHGTSSAELFDVAGMNILVTGGAGVLCSTMARALVERGANVAILDRNLQGATDVVQSFPPAAGPVPQQPGTGRAIAVQCDVLQADSIQRAVEQALAEFGVIDGLINGAGGNKPDATTGPARSFFDLSPEALRWVFELNLLGTILPSQIVGKHMAERNQGVILNISSMNAFRPLTRIPAYSAAKAGVSNFTQWLAVHLAQEYSTAIRVNALAPGFFLTEQNRFLLTEKETGALTRRGNQILDHTPMARFGSPQDLVGPMLWLLSPASAFVTGIVVPIDGGFSAFSGV